MKKKGQITIFVIIGILIVSLIFLFIALREEKSAEIGGKTETNLNSIFESCLEEELRKTVRTISEQGGYMSNPLNISFSFKNEKEVRNISYLCYTTKSYFPCVNQEPMLLTHLEIEIGREIQEKVRECFDETAMSLERKGETVQAEYNRFGIGISPREIKVVVEGEITSTKTGETTTQKNITGKFQSRLYEITGTVQEIVNQEATYCSFDNLGFMLFYPEFQINKSITRNSTTIYAVKHEKGAEKFIFAIRSCSFPPTY